MGKPKIRLNPQVDSLRSRVLLHKALNLLLFCAMLLPPREYRGRGRRPYDYRIVLVVSILRHLLRKRYADYETEMRTDKRIMELLSINKLPCKSCLNYYDIKVFTLPLMAKFNRALIADWVNASLDFILDASGIRLVGRSIWFCIRTKKRIRRKDCDKVHIAICLHTMLIANFAISRHRANDSPFLRVLLAPFKKLGLILADKGYSNKKSALFVEKKDGAFFSPFKSNAKPKGFNYWNKLRQMWRAFSSICTGIYNKRSRVEAVFSALKRKYGDQLYARKWYSRRREMAMRFIAYNVRIICAIQIAREKQVPLWVRA